MIIAAYKRLIGYSTCILLTYGASAEAGILVPPSQSRIPKTTPAFRYDLLPNAALVGLLPNGGLTYDYVLRIEASALPAEISSSSATTTSCFYKFNQLCDLAHSFESILPIPRGRSLLPLHSILVIDTLPDRCPRWRVSHLFTFPMVQTGRYAKLSLIVHARII